MAWMLTLRAGYNELKYPQYELKLNDVEFDKIIICLCEYLGPLSEQEYSVVMSSMACDIFILNTDSISVFEKLEKVCQKINVSEIKEFNYAKFSHDYSDLTATMGISKQDEVITDKTRELAEDILEHFRNNSEYWPPDISKVKKRDLAFLDSLKE